MALLRQTPTHGITIETIYNIKVSQVYWLYKESTLVTIIIGAEIAHKVIRTTHEVPSSTIAKE